MGVILTQMNGCCPGPGSPSLISIILTSTNGPFSTTHLKISYFSRIAPRCQLCWRRIKVWIGPQERNLRASISSSSSGSFSAQHPCWLLCFLGLVLGAREGWIVSGYSQGQGSGQGRMEAPLRASPFGRCGCACEADGSPAGSASRRRSVTMAASLASADPSPWLPDATVNSCSRTQAPPTKRPRGGATCACTPTGRWWLVQGGASISRKRS